MLPRVSVTNAIQNVGYLQSRGFRIQPEHLQEDTVSAHFGDPCIGISVEHERRFAAGLEVGPTVLAVGHPEFFHRLWWWKRIATENCDLELGLVAAKRLATKAKHDSF